MGRKKKFIDKKNSATFQLMARDSSDPNYSPDPSGDRVFVRVDNNDYLPGTFNEGDPEEDSIFADAPEDSDDDYVNGNFGGVQNHNAQTKALPDHIRKEILELGFADDGYNYLTHLREIKKTGGGSAYYHNPKANFFQLPRDVKAYDASRVEVSNINDVSEDKSMYSVASKTVGVRLQKVLDPEVAAMLEDGASSKYASDVEDLEEDFVVRANHLDGPAGEENDMMLTLPATSRVDHSQGLDLGVSGGKEKEDCVSGLDAEKQRVRRPLDEHFDLLECQEYATDSEEEEEEEEEEKDFNGYTDDEDNHRHTLTEKLNTAFKDGPSGLFPLRGEDDEPAEPTAEVIQWCREYAEKYENEDGDDLEEVLVEESSDESEVWDCETIVTTYSTIDNHPGKIRPPPEARRKKKLLDAVSSVGPASAVISLKGKQGLPVEFLPLRGRKQVEEKTRNERDVSEKSGEGKKWKPRGQESKEEKKERKSAVKSERREARQMKKEMKGLYKSEAHRAQKVAAFTGPSSIHLM